MWRLYPLWSFVGAYISRMSDSSHGIARAVVRPPSSGAMRIMSCALLPRVCLWPLPGRLKPPARCVPLSGRRSRFSGDPTWKEYGWSSICPPRKTESWTPKPVKHRDRAEVGVGGCYLGICRLYGRCMATRINGFLISMESNSRNIFTTCKGTMLYLYSSILNLYKLCPSLGSKYPAVTHTVLSIPCFQEWLHIWLIMVAPCLLAAKPQAISLISSARSLSHDHRSTEIVNVKIHTYTLIPRLRSITYSREVHALYVGLFMCLWAEYLKNCF